MNPNYRETTNILLFIKLVGKSILLFCFCLSESAQASFTDNMAIGNAKALSLGHAVTADPPDIDSIHFNPAGLSRLERRRVYIKGVYGSFSNEMDIGDYAEVTKNLYESYRQQYEVYTPDENGNLPYNRSPWEEYIHNDTINTHSKTEGGPTIMLPGGMVDLPIGAGGSGGASYPPPVSAFTFGTNVYTPVISGFHRSDSDPRRFAQQRAAFTLLTYFSPTVAYEFSDELSVGASVNFSYAGMGLEIPIREPHIGILFLGSPFMQTNFCNPDGTPQESNPITGTRLDVCTEVPPYSQYATLKFEVDNRVLFVLYLANILPFEAVEEKRRTTKELRKTGMTRSQTGKIFEFM